MTKENYISIHEIMDEITNHPLLEDVTIERAVSYALELMRIINVPALFSDKEEMLPIENYRVILPCDFYKINQALYCGENGNDGPAFVASSSSFSPVTTDSRSGLKYKIQGNIMITSVPSGNIKLSYQAIATDDDGYPLILNNAAFIRALVSYIKKQVFTILFDLKKIEGGILQNAQQEYAWNVGQAQANLIAPSLDEMESIKRMNNSLLLRTQHHRTGFRNMSNEIVLRKH